VAEGVSEGTNARSRENDRESCALRRTIFETPRARRESRSCTDHYGTIAQKKRKNDARCASKSTHPTASGPPRSSGDLRSRAEEMVHR